MTAAGHWMRPSAALIALAISAQPVLGQSSPPAGSPPTSPPPNIARRPMPVPNPLPLPATGFQWDYTCRAVPANCRGSVFGTPVDGYSQVSVIVAEATVSNRRTLLYVWWATMGSSPGASPTDRMGIVFLDTINPSIQLTGFALESVGPFDLP